MDFPAKQPGVILQFINKTTAKLMNSRIYDSYPYSPRWSAEELSNRLKQWLLETVNEFRNQNADMY